MQERGAWFNYRGWGSPPEGEGPKSIEHYHGGGGSHYLRSGLMGSYIDACQRLADHVLDGEQGALIRAAADGGEAICTSASNFAPLEFGDLRESDHLQVFDDDALAYDRPAPVARLSADELDRKSKLRSPHHGGDGKRTYLPESSSRYGEASSYNGGPTFDKPAATVDERSFGDSEDWDVTRTHWQERRLQYSVPDVHGGDAYGLHRNATYDEDESWADEPFDQEHRALKRAQRYTGMNKKTTVGKASAEDLRKRGFNEADITKILAGDYDTPWRAESFGDEEF